MSFNYNKLIKFRQQSHNEDEQKSRAQLRSIFLSQDNAAIQHILRADLQSYMDGYDIAKLKLVSLDDFVKVFLESISLVHKNPAIIKLDGVDETQAKAFYELLEEVELSKILPDMDVKMRLHNTILTGVRYSDKLDKLYLDNSFNVGSTTVIPYYDYPAQSRFVIRHRLNRLDKDEWIVWDRQYNWNYRLKDEPEFDVAVDNLKNKKYEIYIDAEFDFAESYFPFVKYQHSEQDCGFWGNGFDSLIDLVRTINLLLTVLADDTIAETLRILIMNFVPVGIDGKAGQFKVGMRNPIIADGRIGGDDATAEVVSAALYTDEILKFVDKLVDNLSSMHGIDNVLTKDISADLSGVALAIKNQPLITNWQKNINTVRPYDLALISKIVDVNNFHRTDRQIEPKILEGITIDYQTPNFVTNEAADYELERMKWEDGTSSPLLWIQRRNPEMSEADAKKYIQDNLSTTNELTGITGIAGLANTDSDTIVIDDGDDSTAPVLLNGIQISAAAKIIESVSSGDIPRDSGLNQLMVFLNLSKEQAEKVMGKAGTGKVIKKDKIIDNDTPKEL